MFIQTRKRRVQVGRPVEIRFARSSLNDPTFFILVAAIVAGYLVPGLMSFVGQNMDDDFLSQAPNVCAFAFGMDQHAFHGEYWRWITCLFLHANFAHLAGNLIGLGLLYIVLKRQVAGKLWLLPYFGGGLAGGLAQVLLTPGLPLIGASAAVFGVFGAAITTMIRRRWHCKAGWSRKDSWILGLLLLQLVDCLAGTIMLILDPSLSPLHVGHAAHAGGLIAGAVIGLFLPLALTPVLMASRKHAFDITSFTQVGKGDKRSFDSAALVPSGDCDQNSDYLVLEERSVGKSGTAKTSGYKLVAGTLPADMAELALASEIASREAIFGQPPLAVDVNGRSVTFSGGSPKEAMERLLGPVVVCDTTRAEQASIIPPTW